MFQSNNLYSLFLLPFSCLLLFNSCTGDDARILNLHITSRIQSRFAITHVTSEIQNTASVAKELTFSAQLPADAFISNFTMLVNGSLEVGEVKGKEQAKREYEEAKSAGHTAGLVEKKPRETDLFETSVNVAAGGKVQFNLTYQEVLKRVHGVYKHVVNVLSAESVEDLKIEVFIMEKGRIEKLHVPEYGPKIGEKTNKELLALPDNPDVTKRETVNDGFATVHLTYESETKVTGQLAVLYDVEREFTGGEIEVVDGYFVHFFSPVQRDGVIPGATNIVFVLDKSGSMQGRKFTQLKEAMRAILADLKSEDRFSIIMFSNDNQVWDSSLREATSNNKKEALKFVDGSRANGGTNIHGALSEGLNILSGDTGSEAPDMILFLTDGQPTSGEIQDPTEIVNSISSRNNKSKVRIHCLAFGRDADYKMLRKLSSKNDGLARKIYEASDAKLQLQGFYAEIASPLFTNLDIKYLDGKVELGSLVKNKDDNTFYDGGEVMIVGKMADPSETSLRSEIQAKSALGGDVLKFRCGSSCFRCCDRICPRWCRPWWPCPGPIPIPPRPIPTTTQAPPLPANTLRGFVERMWGYMTIKKLLSEAELEGESAGKVKKAKALQLSLRYNFVSEMTSMVVVNKKTKLEPFEEEKAAPVAHRGLPASPGVRGLSFGSSLAGSSSGRRGSSGRGWSGGIFKKVVRPAIPRITKRPTVFTLPTSTSTPSTTVTPGSTSTCDSISMLILSDQRLTSGISNDDLNELIDELKSTGSAEVDLAFATLTDDTIVPEVRQDFEDLEQISEVPTEPRADKEFLSLLNSMRHFTSSKKAVLVMAGSETLPPAIVQRLQAMKSKGVEIYVFVKSNDYSQDVYEQLVAVSQSQNFHKGVEIEVLADAIEEC